MIKITLHILLILSFVSCSVSTDSSNKLIEKYMKTVGVDEIVDQYSYAYTTEGKRLYKDLPNSFWESKDYLKIMNDYKKDLWSEWRSVYKKNLTESELIQLTDFLNTDLGKKFLSMQKELQPIFTEVSIKTASKLNDKFIELVQNYKSR